MNLMEEQAKSTFSDGTICLLWGTEDSRLALAFSG